MENIVIVKRGDMFLGIWRVVYIFSEKELEISFFIFIYRERIIFVLWVFEGRIELILTGLVVFWEVK